MLWDYIYFFCTACTFQFDTRLFLSHVHTCAHIQSHNHTCTLIAVTYWWMLFLSSPNFFWGLLLLVIAQTNPLAPLHKEDIFVMLISDPGSIPSNLRKYMNTVKHELVFIYFKFLLPTAISCQKCKNLLPEICICFSNMFYDRNIRVTGLPVQFLVHRTVSQILWKENIFHLGPPLC